MIERIKFVPRLFNPVFFHVNKYMKDERVRRIMVYGSSSAAKTYSIVQNIVIDGGIDRKYNTLLFRKESSNIKDTIKNDVSEIIENILSKSPLDTIFKKLDFEFRSIFGNYIRLRGLDKSGKIKGLKGYKKVYLDELDQFTFDDWKELNRRLRGDTNQQIIASWNPVSENHWIKVNFIDKTNWVELPKEIEGNPYSKLDNRSSIKVSEDGRTILIKTVYQDNKWVTGGEVNGKTYGRVDSQVLADFEEMKAIYPYDYQVYGLGEWGTIRPDVPYFHNYKDQIHYSEKNRFSFDPMAETWLSFDFNYDPTTCTVFQIRSFGILGIKTYGCTGGTRELCKLIASDPEINQVPKILWTVTGDSSGNNRSSTAGDVTDYDIISEVLNIGDQYVKVNSRNKSHAYSRRLCDSFLYKIPFAMSNQCEELRNDFLKAKPIPGSEHLYKNRDQGYGMDYMDNFRYFVDAKFINGVDDINRFAEIIKLKK